MLQQTLSASVKPFDVSPWCPTPSIVINYADGSTFIDYISMMNVESARHPKPRPKVNFMVGPLTRDYIKPSLKKKPLNQF